MRETTNLTARIVRDAKANPGRNTILWDGRVKGLGLRITKNNARAWVLDYTGNEGRRKRITLARESELSLADARKLAADELVKIRNKGHDPQRERRDARSAPTVEELWDRFVTEFVPERFAAGRMTERTAREYGKQWRKHLQPALGRMQVQAVTRRDIERMARAMADIPSQRNRCLALTSRLFNLAEDWDWRPQHTNPARRVMRAREEARDRTLNDGEMAALGAALDVLAGDYPAAVGAIRLAALTGFRASEAAGIRWQDVDADRGVIVLPTTKTGRQTRAVSHAALDVIRSMPRIKGCDAVFSARRNVAIGYQHMRNVFSRAAKAAGLEDVRLHDLRRTLATRIAGAGVSLPVLRDVLGHSTITMSARYARMADDAVRSAVEEAGGNVAAVMGK